MGIADVAWGDPISIAWFVGLFGWTLLVTVTCLVRTIRLRRAK